MDTEQLYTFIAPYDETAILINKKANLLYRQLEQLDLSDTDIDAFGKHYFASHHTGKRLFFSIESSADIIYRSVKISNKTIAELSFTDYGAGLGTLFLLAGMVDFKQVYFNDYFPQWAGYARIICNKLGIDISDYISGDIEAVLDHGIKNNIRFDIIASRNVVEHIYDLRNFYSKIYKSNLSTVCYATTTANYHNIAMRLKHYWYHNKIEKKQFQKQREAYLKELKPGISAADLTQLIKLTRGRAFNDFTDTVDAYFAKKPIPAVEFLGTNTCDCKTGVWAENLITRENYLQIIEEAGFKATYTAGFWDTHYKNSFVNLITGLLNKIIKSRGSKGYLFAPFVNVVACKNTNEQ
ncbi:MAG: hypothetical protein ABI685_06045 [Ferruginibacter sp.]